jgi:hypothetical protein
MLKINQSQMRVFEQAAVRGFENRMLEYLRTFSPRHFKILTEDEILEVIRHGMKKAQSHGFTSERSLRIFTELMLILGSGFDEDVQMPWAAEMLGDEDVTDEPARIDRLDHQARSYAQHIAQDYGDVEGEADPRRFIEQIRQLRQEPAEVLDKSAVTRFCQRVAMRINFIFPKKSEYLGELIVRQVINHGIWLAKSYDITTERGIAFFIAMMFMLGSGFDKDPQLPWVSAILHDQTLIDQNNRVDRLFAGAIDCLNRWWA